MHADNYISFSVVKRCGFLYANTFSLHKMSSSHLPVWQIMEMLLCKCIVKNPADAEINFRMGVQSNGGYLAEVVISGKELLKAKKGKKNLMDRMSLGQEVTMARLLVLAQRTNLVLRCT